jgi:hypothetical protein
MVSYRRLLAAVEAALLTPNPAPHHRADLSHALHVCLPDFQAFLKYPVSGPDCFFVSAFGLGEVIFGRCGTQGKFIGKSCGLQ